MKEKNILSKVNVSRETLQKLTCYKELLTKWNEKINLISANDLSSIDEAHIDGALMVAELIMQNQKTAKTICDIGSGSGLPLIVLASYLKDKEIYSVESISKKVHFLQFVSSAIKADIKFLNMRLENIVNLKVDIITAKAFADISGFINLTKGIRHKNTVLYTFKGKKIDDELEKALAKWKFDYKIYNESGNNNKIIVELSNIDER